MQPAKPASSSSASLDLDYFNREQFSRLQPVGSPLTQTVRYRSLPGPWISSLTSSASSSCITLGLMSSRRVSVHPTRGHTRSKVYSPFTSLYPSSRSCLHSPLIRHTILAPFGTSCYRFCFSSRLTRKIRRRLWRYGSLTQSLRKCRVSLRV